MAGELNVGTLQGALDLTTDNWSSGLALAKGQASAFTTEINGIFGAGAMAVGLLTGAVVAAGAAIIALGTRGADVADVKSAFEDLTGGTENARLALEGLRAGTLNTVTDFKLMEMANRAMGAGLQLSAADMKTLAEGSRILADRTGGEMSEAFEKLTGSMGKAQTKGLAQIGLHVDQKLALENYATSIGRTTGELTKHDQQVAISEAVLATLRGEIARVDAGGADFADRLAQVKTAVSNFTDGLGIAIAQSPVLHAAFGSIALSLEGAFGGEQTLLIATLTGYVNQFAIKLVDAGQFGVEAARFIGNAFYGLRVIFLAALEGIADFSKTLYDVGIRALEVARAISLPGARAAIDENIASLKGMRSEVTAVRDSFRQSKDGAVSDLGTWNASVDTVQRTIGVMRGEMVKAGLATTAQGVEFGKTEGSARQYVSAVDSTKESNKQAAAEAKKHEQQLKTLHEQLSGATVMADARNLVTVIGQIGGAHTLTEAEVKRHATALGEVLLKYKALGQDAPPDVLRVAIELDALKTKAENAKGMIELLGLQIEKSLTPPPLLNSFDFTKFLAPLVGTAPETGAAVGNGLLNGIGDVLKKQGADTLKRAFEGGGNLIGAMKSLGISIGEAFVGPIIAKLSDVNKAAIGAGTGLAAALGGKAGGSTGAQIAGIASGLGGAALAATGWGTAMAGAGVAGTVALSAATLGIGAAAVGAYMLVRHFTSIPKEVKAARLEVDAFQGALAETLTITQQQESGGEKWKMTIIAVRDAYLQTGRTAEDAEAIVKQLWNTDKPIAAREAIKKINDVLAEQKLLNVDLKGLQDEQQVKWGDMRDVAQKYGIDLAALGPKFQEARLREMAMGIWQDFALLRQGGADVGGVLMGMRDEIELLVQDSINFGVAIPENFRPLIDSLMQSEEGITINGEKLTDLGKLNFAKPLVDKFAAIVDKIQELIDRIAGPLTGQINAIPRDITVNVHGRWIEPNMPDNNEAPDFWTGTKDKTGDWFKNFGSGTPVNLHGAEAVVRRDQATQFANDFGSGGGGSDMTAALLARTIRTLDALPDLMFFAARDGYLASH